MPDRTETEAEEYSNDEDENFKTDVTSSLTSEKVESRIFVSEDSGRVGDDGSDEENDREDSSADESFSSSVAAPAFQFSFISESLSGGDDSSLVESSQGIIDSVNNDENERDAPRENTEIILVDDDENKSDTHQQIIVIDLVDDPEEDDVGDVSELRCSRILLEVVV